MPTSETIGYLAATLTTASFVPQVWQTFRTRDVQGISLTMYSIFLIGSSLWLVYGLMSSAWPIVVANGVTAALACAILVMKLRFQAHSRMAIRSAETPPTAHS
ncbi:MAG: SemiSWEET transporter [Burkholderiaceae bacterium]